MKIVIVGAGRVGYAIAEQLLTEGHDITVVESDPERAAYISSTLDVIVVEGRANVDQLRIANVADADLLIAATTSDETNLISCMVGRKLGATHTIARVRDEEYYQDVALLQDELGLSLSINPERTSAKEISRTLRFPAATKVEPFANGLVELVEFKLREGSKLDGLRLHDFRGRYSDGILICAVEREGSVTIPNGDFVLAAGDYVTVVGAPHELHELFRKIGEFRHEAESVIIIGGGRIAERLALELARMHIHSTIIERDPARLKEDMEAVKTYAAHSVNATLGKMIAEAYGLGNLQKESNPDSALLKRYTRHYVYWDRNKEEKKRREKEREQALGLFGRSRRKRRTKAVKKPRVASAPSLEKNLFDGSGHDPSVS